MNGMNRGSSSAEGALDNLTGQLDMNLAQFRKLLGDSTDIVFQEFIINAEKNLHAAIIYLENLVDRNRIDDGILRVVMAESHGIAAQNLKPTQIAGHLKSRLAIANHLKPETTFGEATGRILTGDTILLISGLSEALVFSTRGGAQRAVGTPETEVTIRGPRESFVETIGTNIALLRRRVTHPDLMVETCIVGRKTRTNIGIAYMKGVVNEKVLQEIRHRLSRIQTDGIVGAGYIEQLISDAPVSPFSTVSYSERPDVVAAKILEGRVAIIINGSPEVLTVPALFIESFQNPDDYNFNPFYATLIRWIKYIAFGISILGPAVYIALLSYNQELIPTPLFINIATGAEGTPFPVFVEVIIIGLLFEIFREAGIRLPRPVGQGVTFVAALVLAQASVIMGLTGVATVVVVTITAIASLVVPGQSHVSLVIRLILVILASFFGAYGILLGLLWVLAHMVSLRSFGVPYFAPVAPFNPRDFKQDVMFRTPIWAMLTRPRTIGWHNSKRQYEGNMPHPPAENADENRNRD
jgi:spore germination protein KA